MTVNRFLERNFDARINIETLSGKNGREKLEAKENKWKINFNPSKSV